MALTCTTVQIIRDITDSQRCAARREAAVEVIMRAFDGRLAHPENVSGSREVALSPCPGEEGESAGSASPIAEPFPSQPPKSSEAVSSLLYRVSRGTLG